MKRIALIDADLLDNGTRHPNLALMKISGYYKEQGNKVDLIFSNLEEVKNYDEIFISKVFTFTKIDDWLLNLPNVKIGGTGFYIDGGENLPYEIEHHMPDYELYIPYINFMIGKGKKRSYYSDYLEYSIGFATRGCFRKCDFCVNKKYDRAVIHSPISEFLDDKRHGIYLWDDNFLAYSGWEEILNDLEATGKPFQFRQGIDIRLLTEKKAERLSRTKYHGDFIFAFDYIRDREMIIKKLELWRRFSSKTTKLYLLCGYESQDEIDIINLFERIQVLMEYGCLPYIMRHENYVKSPYKNLYIQIARWCNQPQFFKKKSFREFCLANQEYHKNPNTNCATLQTMLDFEKLNPEIAKKYFDLRFDELNKYQKDYGYGRKFAHKKNCESCESSQESWKDAINGLIPESKVLQNYFNQKMDLQCLIYRNSECVNIYDQKKYSDWFIRLLLKYDHYSLFQIITSSYLGQEITKANIPQFSDIDDSIFRTIEIVRNFPNGISFEDLGNYYEKVKSQNEGARKKYGENHGKMSTLIDLTSIVKKSNRSKVYFSVLSQSYIDLSNSEKRNIASKLMFRIPIIYNIFYDSIENETIKVEDYLKILSEATMNRRKSNIFSIVNFIQENSQNQFAKNVIKII